VVGSSGSVGAVTVTCCVVESVCSWRSVTVRMTVEVPSTEAPSGHWPVLWSRSLTCPEVSSALAERMSTAGRCGRWEVAAILLSAVSSASRQGQWALEGRGGRQRY